MNSSYGRKRAFSRNGFKQYLICFDIFCLHVRSFLMDLKKLFLRADYQEIIRLGLDRKAKLSLEERVYFIASLSFLGHDTDAGLDLKKYERKMNRDQRCIARFFLSVSHARKGDFSTALPLLVKNLKNAKEPNASPRERFYAFQGVGFFRQLQSRYRLSLKWSSRAYEIAYFEDDILGKILSGDLKAHSLEAVGRFGEAISLFSSISGLAREQGNTNFSDSIEVSLLCLHSRLGLLQDPEEALQERLSILKSFNTYSRTEILIELLRLKNLKGKGNDFLPLFHKAIALAEKNGHRRHRVNLLCRKSAFHLLSGQHDAALRSLLAAEESLDRKNDLSLYSEVLGLRLRVLSERDSDRRAEIILQLKKIALRTDRKTHV